MGVTEDVKARLENIRHAPWNTRAGQIVPRTSDVALAGGAVDGGAVFLYAELAGSTSLQKEKKYIKSATNIWSDPSTRDVGPYTVMEFYTGHWRHP